MIHPKRLESYKRILKKSWSIRWAIAAGIFSGAEVILPLFVDVIPRNMFALISFVCVACAIWARLLIQPKDPDIG
jgi:hypothetical protein